MNLNKVIEQTIIQAVREVDVESLIKNEVKEILVQNLKESIHDCLQNINNTKMNPTPVNDKRLLNEHEVAEILNISAPTLRKWRWEGKGPQFVKIGHRVAYKVGEIDSYINNNVHENTCY